MSEAPCKLSIRAIKPKGYSYINGKEAHRVAWEEVYGPIPEGLFVCHTCDVKNCIEPTHLFLGTNQENMQDAAKKGLLKGNRTRPTHCKQGHEYTPENTYIESDGSRRCRRCTYLNGRKRADG